VLLLSQQAWPRVCHRLSSLPSLLLLLSLQLLVLLPQLLSLLLLVPPPPQLTPLPRLLMQQLLLWAAELLLLWVLQHSRVLVSTQQQPWMVRPLRWLHCEGYSLFPFWAGVVALEGA
jgi:hypothetical protein